MTTIRVRPLPSTTSHLPPRMMKRAPYFRNALRFSAMYSLELSGLLTSTDTIQYPFAMTFPFQRAGWLRNRPLRYEDLNFLSLLWLSEFARFKPPRLNFYATPRGLGSLLIVRLQIGEPSRLPAIWRLH